MTFWILLWFAGGLLIGIYVGRHTVYEELVSSADPDYRSAVRLKSKFYYIVPEKEYVDSSLNRR